MLYIEVDRPAVLRWIWTLPSRFEELTLQVYTPSSLLLTAINSREPFPLATASGNIRVLSLNWGSWSSSCGAPSWYLYTSPLSLALVQVTATAPVTCPAAATVR